MKWVEKSLDDLGTVGRGRSRHRPRDAAHLYGGAYPFVQTGDVKHAGLYLRKYQQTYSDAGLAQSKMWPAGTLCITIAANIADTAILGMDACFPDSVIGFSADTTKADPRFIKYLFDALLKSKYRTFSQGVAQDNLSQEKLLSIKLTVPEEVAEQRRIADILAAYDDLIANNERRIALLERSARVLFEEWFVRLRYPGHQHDVIVDGVPLKWCAGTVEDFFETASGGTPSRKRLEFYGGAVPWVKTQELYKHFITDTGEKITEEGLAASSAKLFPAKTVLVAMYGATIGEASILAIDAATNQACCALMPRDNRNNWAFAYLFFKTFQVKLVGLSQGAAQNNVSQAVIRQFPMTLPDAITMRLFCANANPMLDLIRILQQQNEKLAKSRDLLLPRLMDGRISV